MIYILGSYNYGMKQGEILCYLSFKYHFLMNLKVLLDVLSETKCSKLNLSHYDFPVSHRHTTYPHWSHVLLFYLLSSFFFVFSVTHSETCGELFGINYFSSILQSQNALSGIFFFFKQPWGLVSTLKMLQTVWAEWKRRTPCLSGYRPRVSIRNSCVCKFSSLMHLLTFLWCCHC